MSVDDLIAAVRDAMDELETSRSGGIGAEGPGLDDLDAYARATGGASWGDDAEYHMAQRAWRLLEDGLDKYERNASNERRGGTPSRPVAGSIPARGHCVDCGQWSGQRHSEYARCKAAPADTCPTSRLHTCPLWIARDESNSAICRNEGVQYTMHPKMARKLASYRRRKARRATA